MSRSTSTQFRGEGACRDAGHRSHGAAGRQGETSSLDPVQSLFAPSRATFARLAWVPISAVACLAITTSSLVARAGSSPPPPPNPYCMLTASSTSTLSRAISTANGTFDDCRINLTSNATIDATVPAVDSFGTVTITNSASGLTLNGSQGLTLNGTHFPDGGSFLTPAVVFLADTGVTTNSGTTSLLNGILQAGAVNAFSPNSDYVLAAPSVSGGAPVPGGQLDLNGFGQVIGSLSGGGSVVSVATGTSATLSTGADNASTTFSGSLSEPPGTTGVLALTKTGTGTFTLNSLTNTYSGGTLISAGTLQLGDGIANGNAGTGAIVDNAVLVLKQGSAFTLANPISGTGAVILSGPGTVTLTGPATYTGATLIKGATFLGGAANVFSTASPTVVATGGTLDLGNFAQTINTMGLAGGTLQNGTLTGAITSAGGTVSAIGGSASLTTIGGVTVLNGLNGFTGGATIAGGTLQLGNTNALLTSTALTIKPGGVFNLNGFNQSLASVSGAGNITLGIGRLFTGFDNSSTTFSGVISGTGGLTKAGGGRFTLGGVNTYSGLTWIQGGTLALTNGSAAGTGPIAMSLNTTLAFAGTGYSFANPIQFVDQSFTDPTIDSGPGTITASGVISGAGALDKTGTGTLILSAINSYTGNTTVSQGTLEVDGSIASSPIVTLASGSALTGIGTVNSINALAGSTVMPGNAANPYAGMSVLGNVILAPGSNYVVNLSPTSVAGLNVAGTATISGANLTTQAAPGSYNTYGRYPLLTASGGVNGTFGNVAFTGLSGLQPEVTYDADHAFLQFVLPSNQPQPGLIDSLNTLAGDRQGQLITNRVLASILGGFNEQINCSNCISGFGSIGSLSAGVHGRFGLTDDIYVFGGLALAHYDSGGANVTTAPIGVLAVRYDFTELGSSRPFVEIGGEASPWQRVKYSRNYSFGSINGTGTGSANSADYATYAKLGWVYRITPQDEAGLAAEIWRGWQRVDGYNEAITLTNPVPGRINSGTDIMNIAKIGGQWTHLWTGVLDSKIETQVNLGIARSFDSHSGVGASFSSATSLRGADHEHSWAEYGLRVGYRFSRSSILDVFIDGTLGAKPIGNTIHLGTGYRYSF
ncbi:autotransporter-associated beta strand repeat-containing protein [Rhizobiales bacterium GAS191]|nr:autotransporter-associated beta strand repeat-containing protein [Rhizobiales bacterium GAS191]